MYIVNRMLTFARGFVTSYGPSGIKKRLWNKEYSGAKWEFIEHTAGDCVYPYLEKYAHGGKILDLGCGPGNTANELTADVYETYVGVDISEVALAKAVRRTEENGRAGKNIFVNCDFLDYETTLEFDIILFRESMYHVPFGQVLRILKRFSKNLKSTGVFIVRVYAGGQRPNVIKTRVTAKLDLIKGEFSIVESRQFDLPALPNVLVFRPRD